jgi:hypothetical protein
VLRCLPSQTEHPSNQSDGYGLTCDGRLQTLLPAPAPARRSGGEGSIPVPVPSFSPFREKKEMLGRLLWCCRFHLARGILPQRGLRHPPPPRPWLPGVGCWWTAGAPGLLEAAGALHRAVTGTGVPARAGLILTRARAGLCSSVAAGPRHRHDEATSGRQFVTLSLSSEVWGSRTEVSVRAGGAPPWRISVD